MSKERASPVTDRQVIVAYNKLHSVPKVARKYGIGETTVNRVLRTHRIKRVGLEEYRATMGRPKTEPYVGEYQGPTEQILKWYESGLSMRAIAKRIGRSVHVVQRRIKQAGMSRPYHGSGPDHSMWIGGRIPAGSGYWKVWVSDDDPMASMRTHQGYVLEHRLVMARKLGRPLLESETVHHKDGGRGSNHPDNLELRQGKHGKHIVMCCLDCGSRNIGPVPLG